MKSFTFFLCLFFLVLSLSAHAEQAETGHDVVYLKNGDRLTGKIITLEGVILQLQTPYGMLDIPWKTVQQFETSGQKVELERVQPPPEKLQQENSVAAVEVLHEEKLPIAKEILTLWGAKFSGRANLGAGLKTGNSETNSVNADGTLKMRWTEHRAQIKAELNREEDEGEVTVDNRSLSGNLDFFLNYGWFINTAAGLTQNDIQELDLRTTLGLGLGHQVYEQDDLNLKYIVGLSYLREAQANESTDQSLAYTWSFDYDHKFWDDSLQFFHGHNVFVPSDETDAFIIDAEAGFRVPLIKGLVGTAEVDFDWDNDPAEGAREDDTVYSLKLGYEW